MKAIRTSLQRAKRSCAFVIFVLAIAMAGWNGRALAQGSAEVGSGNNASPTPAGKVVWQHVARLYLDPSTGKAIWAGYLVHMDGIEQSLFDGAPGEATAYFTFSTDVTLTPLPNNGNVSLSLASPGTFRVYYNPHPAGDWADPASFSKGRVIAAFRRKESVTAVFGPIGFHNLSETLGWSRSFTFYGQAHDLGRMAPHGISFIQYLSNTPLTGSKEYPVAIAGGGVTLAIGTSF